ncbi:MAG TPA: hypothetical protein VGF06_04450, partial [Terriglobales bacterium]
MKSCRLCVALLLACCWLPAQTSKASGRPDSASAAGLRLRDGWSLQSSCKVEAKGETISTPAYQPKGWYTVSVPTTVVAALVKQKVY